VVKKDVGYQSQQYTPTEEEKCKGNKISMKRKQREEIAVKPAAGENIDKADEYGNEQTRQNRVENLRGDVAL
jgi:hypothetical protein